MLDFFAVISKGGLVLWYFQDAAQQLNNSIAAINALIRNVILQERGGLSVYNHENLALKLRMDNEFDLLFVAIYQKILQLSYVDKFLSDVHREFRDKYKQPLEQGLFYKGFDFTTEYSQILYMAEEQSRLEKAVVRAPRTFEQSEKSKKTVESMIEKRSGDKPNKKPSKKKEGKGVNKGLRECNNNSKNILNNHIEKIPPVEINEAEKENMANDFKHMEEFNHVSCPAAPIQTDPKEEIRQKLEKLQKKGNKFNKKNSKPAKTGKEPRIWDLDGKDSTSLDYSRKTNDSLPTVTMRPDFLPDPSKVGTLRGHLQGMEDTAEKDKKSSSGGVFSLFKSLVGGKVLTVADLQPVLEKLKDHLIAKNVAAEISYKLCQSVEAKLEGKHIGTFEGVTSLVRSTLTEALVQLLTPKRRLDILRDATDSKSAHRPYAITFCGVNGVGKSTNLAKISFWLIENNFRVLIAACDTFRAGAVEQLRTHTKHLNALHPPENHDNKTMVELFEQGYGKDAADIARHALEYARKNMIDVVLIDTAGRMQDNEPLMRALAKLIHVNEPDLTLFVGEALVGNEAVDQLVKFNRALSNYSTASKSQMIDGIVLTKFDTIDDKVGAAISMTYITGQPIVFVGTGQTYTDLKSLDPKAVVSALMK
ncbi:Signal recognition particle receptor subunit alpha [Armadillidium nasatum]|uniref:Signal recognition particle receptor subunit alpha n=1 Tax=Armadillidium nasatum TaxID=96803 RepID=A0A5N5T6G3_9CRUS|nr:Signal recognition particle receptor subunit alpha [Armadillidium nasatum]